MTKFHFTREPGRKYDLSGQDYTVVINGVTWAINTSADRGGGGRRFWYGNTTDERGWYDGGGVIVGYGRADFEDKLAAATGFKFDKAADAAEREG